MFPAERAIVLATVVAGTVFAGGCGSVSLSEDARGKIRNAVVAVEFSEEGSYSGDLPGIPYSTRGAIWYSTYFTAPVGMVIDMIDYSDNQAYRRAALAGRMKQADVPVGAMVATAFQRELCQRGIVKGPGGKEAAIQFRLTVEYGLDNGLGLRGSWKPWLEVEGELVDEDGSVLWSHGASRSSDDEGVPEFLDPFWDPARLRASFSSQVRVVVGELIRHLEAG